MEKVSTFINRGKHCISESIYIYICVYPYMYVCNHICIQYERVPIGYIYIYMYGYIYILHIYCIQYVQGGEDS